MNNNELDRVRGNESLTCGLLEAIVTTLSFILTEVEKHWTALNRGGIGIGAVLHFKGSLSLGFEGHGGNVEKHIRKLL